MLELEAAVRKSEAAPLAAPPLPPLPTSVGELVEGGAQPAAVRSASPAAITWLSSVRRPSCGAIQIHGIEPTNECVVCVCVCVCVNKRATHLLSSLSLRTIFSA